MTERCRGRESAALAAGLNACILAAPLAASPSSLIEPGVAVFLTLAAVFAGAEAGAQSGRDSGGGWPAFATGIVLLALFWCALLTRVGSPVVWRPGWIAAGATLMVWGISLRHRAMRALGPQFVSQVRAVSMNSLVTGGVYRRRRHPSEAGLLAIGLGAAVLLTSVVAAIVWGVILMPLVLIRVRREDALLHMIYGEAYSGYARRVRAL